METFKINKFRLLVNTYAKLLLTDYGLREIDQRINALDMYLDTKSTEILKEDISSESPVKEESNDFFLGEKNRNNDRNHLMF